MISLAKKIGFREYKCNKNMRIVKGKNLIESHCV